MLKPTADPVVGNICQCNNRECDVTNHDKDDEDDPERNADAANNDLEETDEEADNATLPIAHAEHGDKKIFDPDPE